MKLAVELPINYQEVLSYLTDFDFLLTHLILENEQYRDFYIRQRQYTVRESILDCSIFELGTAQSAEKVMEAASLVNPSIIISPDVLHDAKQTYENFLKFIHQYRNVFEKNNWKVAGVIHGSTLEEIKDLYLKYCEEPLVSCICIPFDNELSDFQVCTRDTSHMINRLRVTDFLEKEGIVDVTRKHHLLGVALPVELIWQKRHSWITSVDTSAPIVASMKLVSPFEIEKKLVRPTNYFEYEAGEGEDFDCAYNRFKRDLTYFKETIA